MPSLVEIGLLVLESGERFFNFVNVFLLFSDHLPLEKDGALYLIKLESSTPNNASCEVWLNWPSGLGEHFLNFVNAFSLFGNYFPLEKGGAPHLNKLESPSPKDALC